MLANVVVDFFIKGWAGHVAILLAFLGRLSSLSSGRCGGQLCGGTQNRRR